MAEDVEGGMVEVCVVKTNSVVLLNAVNLLVTSGVGEVRADVDPATRKNYKAYFYIVHGNLCGTMHALICDLSCPRLYSCMHGNRFHSSNIRFALGASNILWCILGFEPQKPYVSTCTLYHTSVSLL